MSSDPRRLTEIVGWSSRDLSPPRSHIESLRRQGRTRFCQLGSRFLRRKNVRMSKMPASGGFPLYFRFREMPKCQKCPASGGFPLYSPIGKCLNFISRLRRFPFVFPYRSCPNFKKIRLRRFSFVFPYREMTEFHFPPPAVFLCIPL